MFGRQIGDLMGEIAPHSHQTDSDGGADLAPNSITALPGNNTVNGPTTFNSDVTALDTGGGHAWSLGLPLYLGNALKLYTVLSKVIAANTDNWNPSGLGVASVCVIDVTGATRTLSGFSLGTWSEGEVKLFYLTNTNALTLVHNAGSASGQRFGLPGAVNKTIPVNGGFAIQYLPIEFSISPFRLFGVSV